MDIKEPLLKFRPAYFFIILGLILSIALNYSTGFGGAKGLDIIFLMLLLTTLSLFRTTRSAIVIPYLLLMAIYQPVACIYGIPSPSIIAALMQTNEREATEFIISLPFINYLYFLLTAFVMIVFIKSSQRIKPEKKHARIMVSLSALLCFVLVVTAKFDKVKTVRFFITGYQAIVQYEEQITILTSHQGVPRWELDDFKSPYANIVIIVGESMRSDYMSMCGYPLPTTPFLDTVAGKFYCHYISTAPNTFLSLPRTLSLASGKNFDLATNVVTLANKAGLDTFWLSNQGMLGEFDVPTSKLAIYSKHSVFLKKGDYGSSNTDDTQLLPEFDKALAVKNDHKMIVLHIMGSHPDFEARLNGATPYFHYANKDISDYLSTYRKTDSFIEAVYQRLIKSGQSFKLFYFSDHGLSEKKINNSVYLRHGSDARQNYAIPLVILSSDATGRTYVNNKKSAFNFISLFSREVNIQIRSPHLNQWRDDTQEDIRVFNGETMTEYDKLNDEPAVLLTNE